MLISLPLYLLAGPPVLLALGGVGAASTEATSAVASGLTAPAAVAVADTGQFPLRYGMVLPRADFAHWDADYARYARLAPPVIRRTQMGLGTTHDGVHYWVLQPAATAHVQLDTATRIADPARLAGRWRSVALRAVVYTDSAVIAEQRIYRNVQPLPTPADAPARQELDLAEGRITFFEGAAGRPLTQQGRKKYELVSGRYLLIYGLSRAGGGVAQVGLDAQGRLLLNSYAVRERKIEGQYQTYEALVQQAIFERVGP